MTQNVFYSWQSDRPNNTNRNFISQSIENAISAINEDKSTELTPVLDRDTMGVSGSPDIVETIFAKIEKSDVFICDISLTNDTDRPSPNPNVLIELGVAIKSLGWERIIMIMNTEYGGPELLPFDLRGRRITTYKVAPDAEKSAERKTLSRTLEYALKLTLDSRFDYNKYPNAYRVMPDKTIEQKIRLSINSQNNVRHITYPVTFPTEIKKIEVIINQILSSGENRIKNKTMSWLELDTNGLSEHDEVTIFLYGR